MNCPVSRRDNSRPLTCGAFLVLQLLASTNACAEPAPTNEPLRTHARPKSIVDGEPAALEGKFLEPANGLTDIIQVLNHNVKGKDTGAYDPLQDGTMIEITQASKPVIAEIEGRRAIGEIFWIDVEPFGGGGGGGGRVAVRKELRADIGDADSNATLILTDTISGQSERDTTTTDIDTNLLVCSPADDDGTITFSLLVSSGTYEWTITGHDTDATGSLNRANQWTVRNFDIPPGEYQLTVSNGQVRRRVDFVVFGVRLDFVDTQFAPSVERLTIKYSILPEGFTVDRARLEIQRVADPTQFIFRDFSLPTTGTQIEYMQDDRAGWDGRYQRSDSFVSPHLSAFSVRVVAWMDNRQGQATATTEFGVKVHSLTLEPAEDAMVIMNDPQHRIAVSATVRLTSKDGSGVITRIPIGVDYSFSDPGESNTLEPHSFNLGGGKSLGKKGDPNARYWDKHATFLSSPSDDGLTTRAVTQTLREDDRGVARVYFLPSGVGGDNFILRAAVEHHNGDVLKSADSGTLTVWRQVRFNKLYEMDGETHISRSRTKEKIQPRFNEAFVDYEPAGDVQKIPADKSVEYIGLWTAEAPYQLDWQTLSKKLPEETPTDEQRTVANGPPGEARDSAREEITIKARAWAARLLTSFEVSVENWRKDNGVTGDAIVGIKKYHPKLTLGVAASTDEWDNWVRVDVLGNGAIDPDGSWGVIAGLTSVKDGSITISSADGDEYAAHVLTHEIGHATVSQFKRRLFGYDGDDHSVEAGLMDSTASRDMFSPREIKILRGIEPGL